MKKTCSSTIMVLAALAVLLSLAAGAAAQSFGDFFPGFSAAQTSGSGGRSNTGPILFPNSPIGSETSGVVVGASGFGFVPPGGRTGGARGVYPSLHSLSPGLGPSLRPSLGPGSGLPPSLVSSSYRLGPLRSPLGSPLGGSLGAPLGAPLGRGTTRLRPSVSYSTSHHSVTSHPNSLGPLIWRLPAGRSSSFLSGNSASFSSGAFGSEDYL